MAADTPQEQFKRALAHAARALAEQSELEVAFGSDGPRLSNGVLTLPHPPRLPSEAESASLRGQADRLALRLANHDEALHARLTPSDRQAAEVFEAVEQARVVRGPCWIWCATTLSGGPGRPSTPWPRPPGTRWPSRRR